MAGAAVLFGAQAVASLSPMYSAPTLTSPGVINITDIANVPTYDADDQRVSRITALHAQRGKRIAVIGIFISLVIIVVILTIVRIHASAAAAAAHDNGHRGEPVISAWHANMHLEAVQRAPPREFIRCSPETPCALYGTRTPGEALLGTVHPHTDTDA